MRARPSLLLLAAAGALGLPAAASGAPPWSVPVTLSTPGAAQPSGASVAVAPEGRAIVAWWRRDSALAPRRDVVQIRRRATVGAPFIGPVTLSRVARNVTQPDVAATVGGRAVAGWTEAGTAVVLRVLPGSGPAIPETIFAEGGGVGESSVDVGIAATGAAVAVWTRDPGPTGPAGGDRAVRISVRTGATGAWSAPTDISPPGADHPAVAVAPDGSSIVVWERAGTIEASSGSGAAFSDLGALSAPGAAARFPAVATNAAGDAVVAWAQDALTISERAAGGSFGPPRTISAPGGLPGVANLGAPGVGVADGGRAVVTWRRQIGGAFRVEAAVRPAGHDWTTATVLSPGATRDAGRPALGTDAKGHAVVAWSQPVGGSSSAIRARALPKSGTGFGSLESVSTPAGRGSAPSVGLDGTGRAVLAWREDPVGGSGRVFRVAIRLSPG